MILIHLQNIYFSFCHQGVLAFENNRINCFWWIYSHTSTIEVGHTSLTFVITAGKRVCFYVALFL